MTIKVDTKDMAARLSKEARAEVMKTFMDQRESLTQLQAKGETGWIVTCGGMPIMFGTNRSWTCSVFNCNAMSWREAKSLAPTVRNGLGNYGEAVKMQDYLRATIGKLTQYIAEIQELDA